jgi:hypothetical protein
VIAQRAGETDEEIAGVTGYPVPMISAVLGSSSSVVGDGVPGLLLTGIPRSILRDCSPSGGVSRRTRLEREMVAVSAATPIWPNLWNLKTPRAWARRRRLAALCSSSVYPQTSSALGLRLRRVEAVRIGRRG